jgi:biotin-(acetyl-CoA carboxylase) ligase
MLAVIGIGLNLQLPPTAKRNSCIARQRWRRRCRRCPIAINLLAQLLIDLAAVLDRFADGGFSALRSEWQAHITSGRIARCACSTACCLIARASVSALMPTAPCCCARTAGLERCLSGDLSLRAA